MQGSVRDMERMSSMILTLRAFSVRVGKPHRSAERMNVIVRKAQPML